MYFTLFSSSGSSQWRFLKVGSLALEHCTSAPSSKPCLLRTRCKWWRSTVCVLGWTLQESVQVSAQVQGLTTPYYTLKCWTRPHLRRSQNQATCTTQADTPVGSPATTKLKSDITCCVLIIAPDSLTVEARALLDNTSSASFISER